VELIDISLPVSPGMLAWPTGREAVVHRVVDPDPPRNSEWSLASHAGSHVDAPLHWLPGGAPVDSVALDACFGPCAVVEVGGDRPIEPADLPALALRAGHRILLKTANSESRLEGSTFDPGFVAIGQEAARALADARVGLVGIDYLSVESPSGDGEVHRTLLGAGVVLLEGLDLRNVAPGDYGLSALPVRLAGGEAAPVRAVLWRE
jgi:arylformamidase